MKFFIISIRKYFLHILILLFTLTLVIFSRTSFTAAKDAIVLWYSSIIPSLFSFFVVTELLLNTKIPEFFGKLLEKIIRPIFNIPGVGAFAILLGFTSGYPIGAKITADLREKGLCTKSEGERLLSFTNNSGPLFILGALGIGMLHDMRIGVLLLLTHLFASLTVGLLFRFYHIHDNTKQKKTKEKYEFKPQKYINLSNFGEILTESIATSIKNILNIGGIIIMASIFISILAQTHILNIFVDVSIDLFRIFNIHTSLADGFISGLIEMTNGLHILSQVLLSTNTIKLTIISFVLGFGGIGVMLQVMSVISKTDLSIKPYIFGKLLQGIFAAIYTFLILTQTTFFTSDIVPIFNSNGLNIDSPIVYTKDSLTLLLNVVGFLIIFCGIFKMLQITLYAKKEDKR